MQLFKSHLSMFSTAILLMSSINKVMCKDWLDFYCISFLAKCQKSVIETSILAQLSSTHELSCFRFAVLMLFVAKRSSVTHSQQHCKHNKNSCYKIDVIWWWWCSLCSSSFEHLLWNINMPRLFKKCESEPVWRGLYEGSSVLTCWPFCFWVKQNHDRNDGFIVHLLSILSILGNI